MARVLIIDDDAAICRLLSATVTRQGHEARHFSSLAEGLAEAAGGRYDLLFLDINLPDGNGLAALPRIREIEAAPEVIIITGAGDPDGAELAITSGAWDYIDKGSPIQHIILSLSRALRYREEKGGRIVPMVLKRCGLVGSSPPMQACLEQAAQAALSEANLLIGGATGTGKEMFAWMVHENSPRGGRNFVVVDCATLPETLVESILFGHRRGAFTGADRDREGLFRQAEGGTIFLDEIGELPLRVQKAFLRVLQEQKFRPVGGGAEITGNFRVIAATNRDLAEMARDGQFREDLLYRLRTLSIHLPDLPERGDDIQELFSARMTELCKRYHIGPKGISADFFDCLGAYDWPGNVRELFNTVETVLSAAMFEPTIYPKHLPTHIRVRAVQAAIRGNHPEPAALTGGAAASPPVGREETIAQWRDFRDRMELNYLQELTAAARGDIGRACHLSGLSRSRLYALLRQHDIPFRPR